MLEELKQLREITTTLTRNGYLIDQAKEWEYAFDAIQDLIFVINKDGLVKFVNKAVEEKVGKTKTELVDSKCENVTGCPFNGSVCMGDGVCSLHKDEGFTQKDVFMVPLDGWFTISRSPIKSKTNKLLGHVCVLRDVTARVEAENKLRESEERYRQIFNVAPAGIYEVDYRTGKLISANDAICEYSGYTKAELFSMDGVDLLTEESKKRFLIRAGKVLSGEIVPDTVDYEMVKKDGSVIWVSISNRYVYEGEKIVGATVVAQDITERKQTEEALRGSEECFRNVYDTTPLAFIIWDKNTFVTDWNKKAEEVFGWSKDEVIGKSFLDFLVPEKARSLVENVVSSLSGDVLVAHAINENITKDGKIIVCEWSNSAFHDDNGNIVGAISLGLDVTKREKDDIILRDAEAACRLVREGLREGKKELESYKGFRILIVDDERIVVEVIADIIEAEDRELHKVYKGQDALDKFNDMYYDLVIVDLLLPDIHGIDVIKKIKEISADTPIMAVSGLDSIETINEAMRAGAWDYIRKPVDSVDLAASVDRLLEHGRLIKESRLLNKYI
ncbi:MAG: hypothetical protein DRP42_05925 [Tenericutes bacterium]|nr:MAG: hypothetical protein DRP42_05925 [Mycoplasmatota bacterium]